MKIRHLLVAHTVGIDAVLLSKMLRRFQNRRIPIAFDVPPQNSAI
jgi:hypothetical protein